MARRDALLRLHKSLLARRTELNKKLAEDLNNLRNYTNTDPPGDSADAAFESGSDEMASQLAEIDARELSQIERALTRLKQGTYGLCEVCQGKIPVGRLNALPFTTTCIECQREMEVFGSWGRAGVGGNWEKVSDAPPSLEDQRELKLADLEMDVSSGR